MINYDGYTEEEIKSLSQNNQNLGRIQERIEQLKYELFMMKVRLQVDDMSQKGYFINGYIYKAHKYKAIR